MGIENPVHLLFIAVVALVVLGPRRLPELTRALGHGIREFREAISGEVTRPREPHTDPPVVADPVPPAAVPVQPQPTSDTDSAARVAQVAQRPDEL